MEDINVGERVKKIRTEKGISLRDLSNRAGLSPSMVSQIENNAVNPSINALKGIANALTTPLFKFFQEDVLEENLIVRKGECKIIGYPGDDVQYKLLTAGTGGMLECCLMELPAGNASSDIPRGHNGEEVAYVISGETDIDIDGTVYHLFEGDAIKIPAEALHRWVNHSAQDVKVIFSVTPPGF